MSDPYKVMSFYYENLKIIEKKKREIRELEKDIRYYKTVIYRRKRKLFESFGSETIRGMHKREDGTYVLLTWTGRSIKYNPIEVVELYK